MTTTMKILISVLVTAIIAGGATYYATNNAANVERAALLDQISNKDVGKKTSPTPSASSSPTSSSKYTKLTSTFGYTLEIPTAWSLVRTHGCEGSCGESYTVAMASKTQTNVLEQDALSPIIISASYNSDVDASLTTELNEHKNITNIKDVTIGTGTYAAKRFDDGGGFSGLTVTYLTYIPLADKNKGALVLSISYVAEKATDTNADIQHMLDTLTVAK